MSEKHDVKMGTTTTDDGNFIRTAIQMTGKSNSFDILDKDGKPVARINVSEIDGEDPYVNVDVCMPQVKTQRGTEPERRGISVLAWDNGAPALQHELPNSSVVAVLLMKKGIKKNGK